MEKNSPRRTLRLSDYDYTTPGAYFVTLCTADRACLLGNIVSGTIHLNDLGLIVQKVWLEIPLHFSHVTLDVFVVMPNHLHGIIHITRDIGAPHPLGRATHTSAMTTHASVGTTHASVGTTHASPLQANGSTKGRLISGSLGAIVGSFKAAASKRINRLHSFSGKSIWQRNYYEHIIRKESSLERIREYIVNNPLRWHLDRENPHRIGEDEFYAWMDRQGKNLRDIKKNLK